MNTQFPRSFIKGRTIMSFKDKEEWIHVYQDDLLQGKVTRLSQEQYEKELNPYFQFMITEQEYPKTYQAFADWFKREGWGADNIEELTEQGWMDWFPTFLTDNSCQSAEEFENG